MNCSRHLGDVEWSPFSRVVDGVRMQQLNSSKIGGAQRLSGMGMSKVRNRGLCETRVLRAFHRKPRQVGMTLLELVIVMAIVAILAAIAVPSGQRMIANRLIKSTANALLTASEQARATAVSRAQVVRVCPSADGATCGGADDWADGWITWVDVDNNNTQDATDQLLVSYAVDGNLTVDVPTAIANGYQFGSSGRPSFTEQVTITVCDDRGATDPARSIIFTIAGRGSVLSAPDAGVGTCTS